MARVVVLGGAGGIGSVAVKALTAVDDFDEIVVADARPEAAAGVVSELGDARLRAATFDAADAGSVGAVVDGADVVVNCVGPFYRFGPPVLEAVIAAGRPYVDVCDDLDATVRMLDLDGAAKAAGVTAVLGIGNSPGFANVFVKMCAEQLLDQVETADIMHIHGGEPEEGPAVVKHRIHAMTNDVPLFIDGRQIEVRQLEESGRAHVQEVDFRDVGRFPAYPYPHPETITLPRYIPGIRRVTNLGVVFPLSYFGLTQDMVRVGMCTEEPMAVGDQTVIPIEVAVAHIVKERPRLLAEAGVTGPAGCLRVAVSGTKDGERHTYVCSMSSTSRGAGEGTGIPAALAAILLHRGRIIGGPGVLPPEACVPVDEILTLAGEVVGAFGIGDGGGLPVHIEHIRPDGTTEDLSLSL